jgi:exopolysaccharide biosynthesis polyprenyl glycosylphosphotransferase
MRHTKFPEVALSLPSGGTPDSAFLFEHPLHQVNSLTRRRWRDTYVRRILLSDLGCAALAAAAGALVRFGPEASAATAASLGMAVALPLVWVFAMLVARTYETRFLWAGQEEFRRVFLAAALLLATVGTVSWGVHLEVARGFVVVALPLATLTTLVQRYAWRQHVRSQRRQGERLQTMLLVGHPGGVDALNRQIERHRHEGYQVVGCCVPSPGRLVGHSIAGVPVLGDLDAVCATVRRHDVDAVAVLPSPLLDGDALRRLAWDLEKTSAELLLVPAVTEIVGPRVQVRPVCGMPLMHLERPELRGVRRLTKGVFDRSAAGLSLLLLAPLLLGIAVVVKATSAGPVLFRQERVGRHGTPFQMLKFRTMVDGAEQLLDTLAVESDGNGVLFKKKVDPRVTRVGAVLRRYSLDELPQLINIVRGDMSLVGPRPPLPSEVDRYGFDMHRRFLVKPGLTGLWQISGRSDLSWDESVRIDIRYVENWSLVLDLMIMWRTVGAVLRGSRAD